MDQLPARASVPSSELLEPVERMALLAVEALVPVIPPTILQPTSVVVGEAAESLRPIVLQRREDQQPRGT